MITYKKLNEMLKDWLTKGEIQCDYIRYLHRVDPKLWTVEAIQNEYGISRQSVSNILRKKTDAK